MTCIHFATLLSHLPADSVHISFTHNTWAAPHLPTPATHFFIDLPTNTRDRMRTLAQAIQHCDPTSPLALFRRCQTWTSNLPTPTQTPFAFLTQGLAEQTLRLLPHPHPAVLLFPPEDHPLAAATAFSYSLSMQSQQDDLFLIPLADPYYYLEINHHDEIICTHTLDSPPPPQFALRSTK